jgi:hypothetical protein
MEMKLIPINHKDKIVYAKVDDEDYAMLSRHTWCIVSASRGYAGTFIEMGHGKRKLLVMHRMILGGTNQIDHRNNDPLDNQKDNLRTATRNENEWNKAKFKTAKGKPPTSKYKGVSLQGGRWEAKIMRNKVLYNLGSFKNEEDAARAYNKKAKELSADYSWFNPVPEINQGQRSKT